jgi:hypothetical protein
MDRAMHNANTNRTKSTFLPRICRLLSACLLGLLLFTSTIMLQASGGRAKEIDVILAGDEAVVFTDVTEVAGVGMTICQWGAAWGDYDGDGDQDLYVGNHFYSPNLYRNNGDGTFTDVREEAGIEPGLDDWHGSAWGDYNNDGWLDLYVASGRATNGSNFYANNGDGTFTESAASTGVLNYRRRGRIPRWIDYDKDGHLDIHLTNANNHTGDYGPDVSYHNNGDGTFTDTALQAGLALTVDSIGGAWTDYDGDDYPDVVTILNYPTGPLLFRNQRDGTFIKTNDIAGIVEIWEPHGAVWGDYDNDGDQDLYITRGFWGYYDHVTWSEKTITTTGKVRAGQTQQEGLVFSTTGTTVTFDLWLSQRHMYAREIYLGAAGAHPPAVPFTLDDSTTWVGQPSYTPGSDFGAFIWRDSPTGLWNLRWSNDGTDARLHGVINTEGNFTQVISEGFSLPSDPFRANVLYNNRGDGTFENMTAAADVGDNGTLNARQASWIDYDNDGDLDIYVVNAGTTIVGNQPNILYRNNGDGTFTDVAAATNLLGPTKGFGDCAAWADYNGDGFLDMFLTNGAWDGYMAGPHKLYLNGGNDNHWLGIKLRGTESNSLGFGAKIQVTTDDLTQFREVGVNTAGPCHDSLLAHFGLGSFDQAQIITITWPSGQQQVLHGIPSDIVLSVTEGQSAGVIIAESDGNTDVVEGGTSDTYTVTLMSQPAADAVITVNPDGQTTAVPNSLTFTLDNWGTPQVVTVAAVDDAVDEGLHTGTITHTAASADGNYDNIAVSSVTVNITDDDPAGVVVAESDGSTDVIEGGATDTYTVTLASRPVATVVVTIKPDAQTTIAPDCLTFSPATWDNPQVVTVAAMDDAVDEGLHTGTVTHTAASADGNYDSIAVSSVTVNITDKSDKPNTVYLPLIYKMQQDAP